MNAQNLPVSCTQLKPQLLRISFRILKGFVKALSPPDYLYTFFTPEFPAVVFLICRLRIKACIPSEIPLAKCER